MPNYLELSQQFNDQKYCIIKNAITDNELSEIMDYLGTCELTSSGNKTHLEKHLGPIDQNYPIRTITNRLFWKICMMRIKVLSYANHELIDVPLDETATTEQWVDLMVATMRKYQGWSRLMQYTEDHSFHRHADAVGEIMAILLLSQPGIDYSGGLYINDPKTQKEICIDPLLSARDLMLVDGNYYPHRVETEVLTESGRLSYFINMNPRNREGAWDDPPGSTYDKNGIRQN